MTQPDSQAAQPSKLQERILASASVVLAILLFGAAILAQPAAGGPAVASPTQSASFLELEEEGEELDGEAGLFEEEWEAEEAEEEDEERLAAGAVLLPSECLLRSAEARVNASSAHDTVRLAVRYTTSQPTEVSVDYWLKGAKGSLQLEGTKQRFGERGTLRASQRLSDRAMTKARMARVFIVRLEAPGAPSYCDRLATLHLTAKQASGAGTTWSAPIDASRRAVR